MGGGGGAGLLQPMASTRRAANANLRMPISILNSGQRNIELRFVGVTSCNTYLPPPETPHFPHIPSEE
jgi:hypothetical protein